MTIHLYLSLSPEALIASMLSPEDFGSYYALGSAKNHAVRRFSSKSIQPTDTRISRLMKLSRAVFPTKTAALRPRFTFQSIAPWNILN